jgi:hypothetical protein
MDKYASIQKATIVPCACGTHIGCISHANNCELVTLLNPFYVHAFYFSKFAAKLAWLGLTLR